MRYLFFPILLSILFTWISCVRIPDVEENAQMQFIWANGLYGESNEDEIDAVAADSWGNVYVSGKFENELTIDGNIHVLKSNGMADIMVVKYDNKGQHIWSRQFGGVEEDNVFDADCDHNGNLILSGYFQGSVQFDQFELQAKGGFDMFLVKMNPEGQVIWAKNFGGEDHDGGNEIEVSYNGDLYVGAQSYGTFEGMINSGGQDAYLLALDSEGNTRWIRSITGSGDARAKAITTDNLGNVYMGGDFKGDNEIVNSDGTLQALQKYGGRDAYLISFSNEGTLRWHKSWGNSEVDFCKGIAMNEQNELYAVGQFQKNVQFDHPADQYTLNSTNGTKDLFVLKLSH